MKVTKQYLIDLIEQVDEKFDKLLLKINQQSQKIDELNKENDVLRTKHQETLVQVKEYIKELKEIRAYYVDSNNKSGE